MPRLRVVAPRRLGAGRVCLGRTVAVGWQRTVMADRRAKGYVEQGKRAFLAGKSREECPYTGLKRCHWVIGWSNASAAAQEAAADETEADPTVVEQAETAVK